MNNKLKKLAGLATIATLALGLNATAQNVQEGSVWAPANAKVDAKIEEWGNDLKANNKATNIYYTIANDDKFLYLVVKSTDQANNMKIMSGGITFSINTDGKKKDKDAFQVVYPVVNREAMRSQFRRGGGGPGGMPGGQPQPPDSATIANMRNAAMQSAKEITLRGFKDIPDSVISIYNEYSIKAAVGYDKNGNFVYELALPFEQLGIKAGSTKELAYNVKVNGLNFRRNNDGPGGERREGGDGGGNVVVGGGGGGGNRGGGGGGFNGGGGGGGGVRIAFGGGGGRGGFGGMGGMNFQDMLSPTDFWGKYTLAKK